MTTTERIGPISAQDLALLGLAELAYLRPAEVDGQSGFAIYSANGRMVGFAPDRNVALRLIRDNDLEPVSLH